MAKRKDVGSATTQPATGKRHSPFQRAVEKRAAQLSEDRFRIFNDTVELKNQAFANLIECTRKQKDIAKAARLDVVRSGYEERVVKLICDRLSSDDRSDDTVGQIGLASFRLVDGLRARRNDDSDDTYYMTLALAMRANCAAAGIERPHSGNLIRLFEDIDLVNSVVTHTNPGIDTGILVACGRDPSDYGTDGEAAQ
jgi:hypothetical protein